MVDWIALRRTVNHKPKHAILRAAPLIVLAVEDELSNQTVWVKNLETKEEKIINIAHF